jgi:hypothetical protein
MWWTLAGDVVVATNNSKVASEGDDDIFLFYYVLPKPSFSRVARSSPIVSPSAG